VGQPAIFFLGEFSPFGETVFLKENSILSNIPPPPPFFPQKISKNPLKFSSSVAGL
jgi:hypothetical protein